MDGFLVHILVINYQGDVSRFVQKKKLAIIHTFTFMVIAFDKRYKIGPNDNLKNLF